MTPPKPSRSEWETRKKIKCQCGVLAKRDYNGYCRRCGRKMKPARSKLVKFGMFGIISENDGLISNRVYVTEQKAYLAAKGWESQEDKLRGQLRAVTLYYKRGAR